MTPVLLLAAFAALSAAPADSSVAVLVARNTGFPETETMAVSGGVAGALARAGLAVDATTKASIRRAPEIGKCARQPACIAEKTSELGVAAVVIVEIAALRGSAVLYVAAYSTREPLLFAEANASGARADLEQRLSGPVSELARHLRTSLEAQAKAQAASQASAARILAIAADADPAPRPAPPPPITPPAPGGLEPKGGLPEKPPATEKLARVEIAAPQPPIAEPKGAPMLSPPETFEHRAWAVALRGQLLASAWKCRGASSVCGATVVLGGYRVDEAVTLSAGALVANPAGGMLRAAWAPWSDSAVHPVVAVELTVLGTEPVPVGLGASVGVEWRAVEWLQLALEIPGVWFLSKPAAWAKSGYLSAGASAAVLF